METKSGMVMIITLIKYNTMYIKNILTLFLLCGLITKVLSGNNVQKDDNNGITKDSIPSHYNLDSLVQIPFGTITKINSTNDIGAIYPENTLLFDNILDVSQFVNGKIPGLIGNTNIRGLGGALVVIDGVPRSFNSVNVDEIEQITVLKDVNSSLLYGTRADKGVILIKTKRGKPNQKRINVFFETG